VQCIDSMIHIGYRARPILCLLCACNRMQRSTMRYAFQVLSTTAERLPATEWNAEHVPASGVIWPNGGCAKATLPVPAEFFLLMLISNRER
jgi:hypothetical protein